MVSNFYVVVGSNFQIINGTVEILRLRKVMNLKLKVVMTVQGKLEGNVKAISSQSRMDMNTYIKK